ncbi:MAG: hypothetical protein ACI870_000452 [Crocinitomicaceae bacterium]|jgi:hypothetical protein
MDFNINEFLKKRIKEYNTPEDVITSLLKEELPGFKKDNISLMNGKIYLKNISPIQKTHIKLNKKNILSKLKEKDIRVRDII